MSAQTNKGEENKPQMNLKKAPSSYCLLKKKYVACKVELTALQVVVEQLRNDLDQMQLCTNKKRRTEMNCQSTTFYHRNKFRSTILEEENAELKVGNEKLKATLVHERQRQEALIERNEVLEAGKATCCIVMEELRAKISKLSNANELLTSQVRDSVEDNEMLKQQVHQHDVAHAWQRRFAQANERAVSRAFGWKKSKVDPTLFRAACGFWTSTVECDTVCDEDDVVVSRVSFKKRMEIWTQLTWHGFQGKVIAALEKEFFNRKKFNVVEICRKSDVESQFNAVALQSMANCESGKKKYTRGLLCSDATLRRMQKKVHKLAERLGFSSLPTEEEGNVWCWGDSKGNFETAVNRYVYEIYVKARCDLVTKDKPWQIALTGDLARVNFRGKAITIGGPKQVDPRLPNQEKTGKTSNQSREMYTPAVAGYVNEGYVMSYFNAMVAAFRQIESQGYCVVGGEAHTVYIDVSVVADMAFLHKYMGRGGGSHACTNFCWLCSVTRKYRQEGYPGGCTNCRNNGIVYDKTTGCQQCLHHDVCTPEFMEWQKERMQYLEDTVKPRIPKCARPFYEDKVGLKEECLARCKTAAERQQVDKMKSIATLEKWLKGNGRTRDGCDLSCNLHTGVRIAPMAVVIEDLRLRHVYHALMSDSEKRHALEMLLREEEEYMKLQMYLRDDRLIVSLQEDPEHCNKLFKTLLDVLHMPMRTNEKVLTLLYEEVTQGAHKAQATIVLNDLTPIIRRLGGLGELWTHQFDEKNTKVIKKFKLPYDQSRKIFAIEQLPGLLEAVHVAIPPSQPQQRTDWISFLYHYVHMNAFLHRSEDYSAEDMDVLEIHIESCYKLLVTRIGGAERGVTNYFHYIGSGHVMWMIRRYGNLWRFCNEGAEHLNALVSKRYNLFNNKGGYKKSHVDGPKKKCLPFEVLGAWMGRLSLWHTGLAVDYFLDAAWDDCQWMDAHTTVEWCAETKCYLTKQEFGTAYKSDVDSDWNMTFNNYNSCTTVKDYKYDSESDDDENDSGNESEDIAWMSRAALVSTWKTTNDGVRTSMRARYQQYPIENMS